MSNPLKRKSSDMLESAMDDNINNNDMVENIQYNSPKLKKVRPNNDSPITPITKTLNKPFTDDEEEDEDDDVNTNTNDVNVTDPDPNSSNTNIAVNSKKIEKAVIAVDLDEVLCQFLELMCRYVNENKIFGDKRYTVSDFNSYLFHDVWGGSKDETTKIVQDFLSSNYFTNIDEMKPIENAYKVLFSLKSKFKFVICTSRQLRTKDVTFKWINRFFPDIFDEIVFGNHFGLKGRKISKPDLCKQLNARILIDDSSYYAKQSHSTLDYVVIFDWNGKYGWNKTKKQIATNVHRLYDWNQIQTFLEKYHMELISN